MSVFFISDAHLGENFRERETQKREKLLAFLNMVKSKGEQLYVVGDLFDFWFEYKHAIPKTHMNIIIKFSELHRAGIKLFYVTGNHDHWLGDFITNEVGFHIFRDRAEIKLDDLKVLVIHGDGLAKKDGGYRILKKILRNRVNIFLYRLVPPDLGIPLAKWVSGVSRGHTQKRPKEEFLEEYRQFAHDNLKNAYQAVIIAHTHVPERIEYPEGIYLNTGDWVENFSYVEYDRGEFKLKYWKD